MSDLKYYLMYTGLIAFLILELVGLYWMQTGSPPSLAWVDSTVLGWSAAIGLCGVVGIRLWNA